MRRETHSEKGLKTISLMGTESADWHLTPLKWKYVYEMVPTKVKCPTCRGRGQVNLEADGSVAVNEIDHKKDYYKWNERQQQMRALPTAKCPECPARRGWSMYGTGEVVVMKKQKVLVAFPVWAKGTEFDSRFRDAKYSRSSYTPSDKRVRHVCELCSKSITGVWSYRVPVQARGADGKIHGMWVGEDCARKILGVEIVLSDDQKKELKDSVYKHWIVKEAE
jgi:hypothetical protein